MIEPGLERILLNSPSFKIKFTMTVPTKILLCFIALFLFSCNEEPASSDKASNSKAPTNEEMLVGGLTENLVVLQGNWQNKANEAEIIQIEKNKFLWKKFEEESIENWVEAYSNCPNFCSTKNSSASQFPCFILKEGNSASCYAILKLDKDELIFTPIAGKPNVQTFIKLK